MDDRQLLNEYLSNGSQAAFTALAQRNLGLVYSSARRQVGEEELARDVTQAVFMLLADKASTIREGIVIAAWLLKATRYASNNALKMKRRREHHEREAAKQRSEMAGAEESPWNELSPQLDGAIDSLGEADRNAIVLRYFENKPLVAVGMALGVSADAAEKRVSRAVDKLRVILSRRGVTLAVAVVAALLGSNAVQAAPVGLETALFSPAIGATQMTASQIASAAWQSMNAAKRRIGWATGLAAMLLIAGGVWIAVHSAWANGTPKYQAQGWVTVTPAINPAPVSSDFVETGRLAGHPAGAYWLAFLADGQIVTAAPSPLVLGSYGVPASQATVRIMGFDGLKETRRLNIDFSPISAFAITTDGSRVAVAGGETDGAASVIRIFDIGATRTPIELSGHKGAVTALAFTADGKRLLSAAKDRTVWLWDLQAIDKPRSLSLVSETVTALAVSRDAALYAYAEGQRIRVINLTNDLAVKEWSAESPVKAISFAGDGAAVHWGDTRLHTRNPFDDVEVDRALPVAASRLAISGDGKQLLLLCEDNTVRRYRRE